MDLLIYILVILFAVIVAIFGRLTKSRIIESFAIAAGLVAAILTAINLYPGNSGLESPNESQNGKRTTLENADPGNLEREITLLGANGLVITVAFESDTGQRDSSIGRSAVESELIVREFVNGDNVGFPIKSTFDLDRVGRICAFANSEPARFVCKLPPYVPNGPHNAVAVLNLPDQTQPGAHLSSRPTYVSPGCSWTGLLNDRTTENGRTGMGMSICPDGMVINGDGLHVGDVVERNGNQITIDWNQGNIDIETFEWKDYS